ncbi:hypothetical protein FGO68_gene1351 [Halteria grandinella]|uniref:Glycosyltransferase subfamily 4-like N-terminal domain-containing protein n=1 Tax=Halteria grandinella TaxID=5974 RepID=A0A8J8NAF2_HALGN|nr:hypothetical protein FGO68_gene1351 [Halteria grandinella]
MIANISHDLIRRGHELNLFLVGSPTDHDYEVDPACQIFWRRDVRASARAAIPALARHLRAKRYDILLSAMPAFNNAAVIARLIARVPTKCVLTERTNPDADYQGERSWKRRMWHKSASLLYPKADARIAVSKGLADALANFARLSPSSIDVVYNPAYHPRTLEEEPPSRQLHPWLNDGIGPVVIAAGRLVIQKDFGTLLRAIKLARSAIPGRLIIFGDGPLRQELSDEIARLELGGVVAMPGFVRDIRPSLTEARYFVLSSAWEGFGNVIVEALGCGCSIVSTDCPNGPSEILDYGRYGQLVAVGDHEGMAKAIIQMIAAPSVSEHQIARASEFSVAAATSQYEAIFRRVLLNKTRRERGM